MQTGLTREAAGTLKVRLSYESVGKNHNGLHREKDMGFRGSGGPQNDAKKTPGAPLYSPWGVQGALCGLREATFARTVFQRLFCTIFLYFWGPAGGPKMESAARARGARA